MTTLTINGYKKECNCAHCGRPLKMGAKAGKPDCYLWAAKWWRLAAKENKSGDSLRYARSQMALYRDMLHRPEHYASHSRTCGLTDWQWSGLSSF